MDHHLLSRRSGPAGGESGQRGDLDEELSALEDEVDGSSAPFCAGTLSFTEDDTEQLKKESSRSPHAVPSDGAYSGCDRVTFEVISAEKVKEGRSSYVLYTILINKKSGVEKMPMLIEKRYSDFKRLNSVLRKKFPGEMEEKSFPKKLLTGNFSRETIAWRSRAFEQYLTDLFSVDKVRYSEEFAEFFFLDNLKNAYNCIFSEKYLEAIFLLEKCLPIQERIHSEIHPDVQLTICAIAVCYHLADKPSKTQQYAEMALGCMPPGQNSELRVAVINLLIRVCWTLGKDKRGLEEQLQQLKRDGVHTECVPSLLDIVKARCHYDLT